MNLNESIKLMLWWFLDMMGRLKKLGNSLITEIQDIKRPESVKTFWNFGATVKMDLIKNKHLTIIIVWIIIRIFSNIRFIKRFPKESGFIDLKLHSKSFRDYKVILHHSTKINLEGRYFLQIEYFLTKLNQY